MTRRPEVRDEVSAVCSAYLRRYLAVARCPLPASPAEAGELRDRLRAELAAVRHAAGPTRQTPVDRDYEHALVVATSWLHEVAAGLVSVTP